MTNTLIYILLAYGLTNILIYGSIFEKPRTWLKKKAQWVDDLLSCMMCSSFWVGVIIGWFVKNPVDKLIKFEDELWFIPLTALLYGVFTSGCVWLIHTIQEYFERSNPSNN